MDFNARKLGLPVALWVVIGVVIVIGLVMFAPMLLSQMTLGDIRSPEDARGAMENMSQNIDGLGDILGDIDDSLG